MIEKLDSKMDCVEITVLGKHTECLGFDSAKEIGKKLNELVDKVNDLTTNLDGQARTLIEQQDKIAILEEHAHPTATTEPADPYAEQRKCICKLCWFWNDNKADKVIGILTGVFDEAYRPFERNIDQTLYKYCEPVKPDDNIIYKGGDNE